MTAGRVPGMGDPRKLSPSQARIARTLGPLEGERVPGGCDSCDAYQDVRPVEAGIWSINVYHDPSCPVLAAIEERQHG